MAPWDRLEANGPVIRAARYFRVALTAVAIVLIVGPSSAGGPSISGGARPEVAAPPAGDSSPVRIDAPAPPKDANRGPSPEVPVVSADGAGSETSSPVPTVVEYPRLGAELPVTPTGVSDDGQMAIPDDAAQAGWYKYGPTPADGEGDTVVAAHSGSEQTPEGPLYSMHGALAGDEVVVTDAEGQRHHYTVTAVEQLGKEGLDFTPYFARTGPERLVLITCGGQWVPERGSYADNIIVVAEPVH